MQTVLENYERVRSAVLKGNEPPENLQQIAVAGELDRLRKNLVEIPSEDRSNSEPQPINIVEVREYTTNCSVVIVKGYFNDNFGFILTKIDGKWKVRWMSGNIHAGISGLLPLRSC